MLGYGPHLLRVLLSLIFAHQHGLAQPLLLPLQPAHLPPLPDEQLIHRLHAPALAFGESQPHPHDADSGEGREEREGPPGMHCDGHVREEAGDEEVEHVLVSERHRDDGAAGARRTDFRRSQGEDGSPAETVACVRVSTGLPLFSFS